CGGQTHQATSCVLAHAALVAAEKVRPSSGRAGPAIMSASIHSRRRTSMNDARRKEVQRALTLIGEAKGILELALSQEQDDLDNMPEDLQGDEEGQIAEDVVDALERAAMGCGDAITACREAM